MFGYTEGMSTDIAPTSTPTTLWRIDTNVLITAAIEREAEKRRLEAEQGEMLAELDRRGIRDATGYGSLRELIGDCLHVSSVEAKARAERATALNSSLEFGGHLKPALAPLTAKAAAEGAIGAGQIDAITKALKQLPDTVTEEDRIKGERILVDLARRAGPREITQAGARMLAQLDPDGREPKDKEPKEAHRSLTLTTRKDGTHHIKGILDDETYARLAADLAPLAKRRP